MNEMAASSNQDAAELAKFGALAHGFWDRSGPFRTLHDIEPARVAWIAERVALPGARVADVGCGGGLLAESLTRLGARVTAIDLALDMLAVARAHAASEGLQIDFREQSAAALAAAEAGRFDAVCCMEMIEHVPEPAALLQDLARLLRPGGTLIVSTLNRNVRSFLGAIVGAEYVFGLVPRGTHEYARLVRPAELAAYARAAGLTLHELTGLQYNPLTRTARPGGAPTINYLARFTA
jgi:2-polyprenyl-6-hydroxyphenyl methylase/3-demethylubiquinone-9 3-methyltransferase